MSRPAFAVEVITLLPQLWPPLLAAGAGLVGRAFAAGQAQLTVHDLRQHGVGPHRQVDDAPFGGGPGMVLQVPPLHRAIDAARARTPGPVLLLSPRGPRLDQARVRTLAAGPGMVLVCGRFEGVDERVHPYVDGLLSVGDFVLTGGDPAAFCLIDAVVRLLPSVVGNPASLQDESFSQNLLEYPQYTRPSIYAGAEVPPVLRGGNHAAIAAWRQAQARALTTRLRPDLLAVKALG